MRRRKEEIAPADDCLLCGLCRVGVRLSFYLDLITWCPRAQTSNDDFDLVKVTGDYPRVLVVVVTSPKMVYSGVAGKVQRGARDGDGEKEFVLHFDQSVSLCVLFSLSRNPQHPHAAHNNVRFAPLPSASILSSSDDNDAARNDKTTRRV